MSKYTVKRACRLKATSPNFSPITSFQGMRLEHSNLTKTYHQFKLTNAFIIGIIHINTRGKGASKMVQFTPELKQSFLDMLDNHKTENDIQRFLEEHTEMIPLPFLENHGLNDNAIITKFKLGSEMTTDFAYLTKCSDYWNFVLVELEDSRKKLFTENKQQVTFHHEFNHAYDQITAWKAYVENNRERLLYQTEK